MFVHRHSTPKSIVDWKEKKLWFLSFVIDNIVFSKIFSVQPILLGVNMKTWIKWFESFDIFWRKKNGTIIIIITLTLVRHQEFGQSFGQNHLNIWIISDRYGKWIAQAAILICAPTSLNHIPLSAIWTDAITIIIPFNSRHQGHSDTMWSGSVLGTP